jgi:hypothetical protein
MPAPSPLQGVSGPPQVALRQAASYMTLGEVPEWSNGTVSKSVDYCLSGTFLSPLSGHNPRFARPLYDAPQKTCLCFGCNFIVSTSPPPDASGDGRTLGRVLIKPPHRRCARCPLPRELRTLHRAASMSLKCHERTFGAIALARPASRSNGGELRASRGRIRVTFAIRGRLARS